MTTTADPMGWETERVAPDGGPTCAEVGIVTVIYEQSDASVVAFLDGLRAMAGGPYRMWLALTKPGRVLELGGDDVTVVGLDENVGWTGGANAAAAEAMRSGCRDLVFMNTDVHFLSSDLLVRLLGALHSDPRVGFVSPVITTFPDTSLAWYRGARLSTRTWITRHPGIGSRFEPSGALVETGMANGCCMAVSGRAFAELGGFDEALFAYFDEADLAYRARAIGWRATLLDDPLLAHEHRGRELTTVAAYYFGRNPLLLARKHSGPMRQAVAASAHFVASPYYLARCGNTDAQRAYLRGLSHGLAHLFGRPHVGRGH